MSEDRRSLQELAGEYALGLLDAGEAAAFESRAARDPAAAAALSDWRERLVGLDAAAPPIPPSAELWARIDGAIDARETHASTQARAEAPPSPSLAARLWGSVAAWRGAALAGAVASVALAFVSVSAYRTAERQPQVIAVLLTPDGKPGAIVDVFADGSSYVAPLLDVSVPSDRIMQVWTLPDKTTGPVSLGLLENDGSARLQPASLPAPKPQQLYEITLEPSGGSPTGRPTGPILFKGFAERPR
ncbi:anti-sigma factor [Methylopila sp. M107]|uniref:anti-sigma factor n=1 Tax=Methylopila sp. M107 TaxID=1101190 RepID=UPI000369FB1B|nr:anti-sigma factor [Methylopila sp. M107]